MFANPTELKIGSYEVTGKIERTMPGEKAPTTVAFTSNIRPMNERLAELLEEKGIPFDNSDGPSTWRAYIPMLALTVI